MRRWTSLILVAPLLCLPASYAPAAEPIAAVVETTLATADGQIRQFAFDGDPDTYFASDKNPTAADHFTLVFDKPAAVKSITATTGRPKGGDALEAGTLQVSADGKTFEDLAKFVDGAASAKTDGRMIQAIRIKPTEDLKHPLTIREIAIDSDPAVSVFKYPIEVVVDVSDAPEMKEWAEKSARICEREYPLICEDLKSDGWTPRRVIEMRLKSNYRGVAATERRPHHGVREVFQVAPRRFRGDGPRDRPHDSRPTAAATTPAGWSKASRTTSASSSTSRARRGRVDPERSHYDGSYRVTATFLNYVAEKYDKELVRKLNVHMREGNYSDGLFKDLTGKTLKELDDEWRASLKK